MLRQDTHADGPEDNHPQEERPTAPCSSLLWKKQKAFLQNGFNVKYCLKKMQK